jgi:hypothetical protein
MRRGMNRASARQGKSLQEIRVDLVERLRARSTEIEEAIFSRVQALSDPAENEDAEYSAGLRATVAEAVAYALVSIEQGEDWTEPIPSPVALQARRAARNGIGLDTVLRRYAAGDRLLAEFITEEGSDLPNPMLRQVLRAQGPQVDRMMAAVAAEYMGEMELMRRSPSQRLAERVQRLLAGDSPLDAAELEYEFEAWHVGLVVNGARADVAARTLGAGLSRQVLVVLRGDDSAWAWLGGQDRLSVADIDRYLSAGVLGEVSLAVGEPRYGLEGWRLTHDEAHAARRVMLRRPQPLTRASDVILLSAVLSDDSLARSLRQTYLAPLDDHGDSGFELRETLRAYFTAGFNAATAAAALEVDRHTVQRRLRKAESAIGSLLQTCHAELSVALRLEELDDDALGQNGESRAPGRTTMA